MALRPARRTTFPGYHVVVADFVFIFVAMAFFGLCAALVRGLDRMGTANDEAPGSGVKGSR
jgi:hypothetical protein